MGYFDKSLKILNSKGDQRVYVSYNKVTHNNKSFSFEKKLRPVPVKFVTGKDLNLPLQKSFNIIKHLSLLRIYSNNYLRHCVHRPIEEEGKTEKETFVDFCIIFVETKKNRVI